MAFECNLLTLTGSAPATSRQTAPSLPQQPLSHLSAPPREPHDIDRPPATQTWDQVEQQIERHRRQVRLCGPLSVAYLLSSLGHPISSERLCRPYEHGDPQGVPLAEVVRCCHAYEPQARLSQFEAEALEDVPTPSILVVNENRHCIVLESLTNTPRAANIWDPSDGKRKTMPLIELQRMWRGLAIVPRPTPAWQLALWCGSRASFVAVAIMALFALFCRRRAEVSPPKEMPDSLQLGSGSTI